MIRVLVVDGFRLKMNHWVSTAGGNCDDPFLNIAVLATGVAHGVRGILMVKGKSRCEQDVRIVLVLF